ncbi:MAG: DUF6364 family protein [Candidatus Micrarchaeales archaeon]|nr:DUF6364 family protein [Candidatus Micrarchaeales archaeon]
MAKAKVTLSVDERLLTEARSDMIKRKLSLSSAFESLLKSFTRQEIEDIANSLGIGTGYVSYMDVAKLRKRGGSSGKEVRAMRDERAKSLS